MTRRTALHVLNVLIGGFVGKFTVETQAAQVVAQVVPAQAQSFMVNGTEVFRFTDHPATSLHFDIGAFAEYRFSLDGKAVVVTPQELFAALQETP